MLLFYWPKYTSDEEIEISNKGKIRPVVANADNINFEVVGSFYGLFKSEVSGSYEL